MSERWCYMGDVNLEQGGLFYTLEDGDTARAVEVRPERGGGQTADSWVVSFDGDIHMRGRDLESALDTCGYWLVEADELVIGTPTGETHSGDDALKLRTEAFHAHSGIEDPIIWIVTREELGEMSLAEYVVSENEALASAEGAPKAVRDAAPDTTPSPS